MYREGLPRFWSALVWSGLALQQRGKAKGSGGPEGGVLQP